MIETLQTLTHDQLLEIIKRYREDRIAERSEARNKVYQFRVAAFGPYGHRGPTAAYVNAMLRSIHNVRLNDALATATLWAATEDMVYGLFGRSALTPEQYLLLVGPVAATCAEWLLVEPRDQELEARIEEALAVPEPKLPASRRMPTLASTASGAPGKPGPSATRRPRPERATTAAVAPQMSEQQRAELAAFLNGEVKPDPPPVPVPVAAPTGAFARFTTRKEPDA